mgnify:CR=1 FL=1
MHVITHTVLYIHTKQSVKLSLKQQSTHSHIIIILELIELNNSIHRNYKFIFFTHIIVDDSQYETRPGMKKLNSKNQIEFKDSQVRIGIMMMKKNHINQISLQNPIQ